MNSLKLLSAAATVALVLPLASPSFAQQSRAAAVGAGGGAAIGGGGAAVGGGGGGFGGGARMGGGGAAFQGGGGGFGGGAAMRPSGGNFAGGGAVRPGGGSFVGGAADRAAISPSFSGTRSAAVAGNWQGGSGNWSGRHWHGRHHHHHRHGGFWPGFAAGAAIGGLGSYAYYGSGYGYYDDPYYYGYYDEPSVAVVQDGGGDAAYCARRFKSYDPASGTYLGYDGRRHPCP